MKSSDLLSALCIVAIWGFSFVAIKVGLKDLPPFTLNFWRFLLAAVPAVFFLARPAVLWRWIIAYGLLNGVAQFGLLYTGIKLGMPAGLASLVIQSQAFFTIILVVWFFGEPMQLPQKIGGATMVLGLIALATIKYQQTGLYGAGAFVGFCLTLCAGLAWAFANISAKVAKPDRALAYIAWGSLVAAPVNALIALWFEDTSAILMPLQMVVDVVTQQNLASWIPLACIAYLAWPSTSLAFGLYNRLLSRYPVARIAPFTLLVPITGMGGSAWFLGERFSVTQILACAVVFTGLIINVFGHNIWQRMVGTAKAVR